MGRDSLMQDCQHHLPDRARLPLLVFLHGVGERGTDPALIRQYALPKVLDEGLQIPFFVYAPQCPDTHRWEDLPQHVMSGTEDIRKRLPVDQERIYLTGFSMGGQGLWAVAVQHPDAFVAYAPVSGRIPKGDFLPRVAVLKDKPLWVFHGAVDVQVDVENSDRIVAALREAGADKLQYTRYADAGHGEASDWTYQNEALYRWLLDQS